MWGNQIRDVELTRGIYEVSLNINKEGETVNDSIKPSAKEATTAKAPQAAKAVTPAPKAGVKAPAAPKADLQLQRPLLHLRLRL